MKRKYIDGKLRRKLWEKYHKRCCLCGDETLLFKPRHRMFSLFVGHVDHIIPFSKGGQCAEENFRWLCERCNLSRGNRNV